jgi:prepilin-type processing-associated H-X9-DG protein
MEQALNAGRVNPRITRDASRVPAFYDCAAPASQETDPYSYIPQVTQATRMGPMLYLQTNVGPNLNLSPRPPTWDDPGFGSFSINRHDMAINVAFVDGHAETVKLPDLYTLKWSEAWTQTSPKAPRPLPDFLD